jgi:hypothetical protein
MNESIQQEELNGLKIKIFNDEYPQSPEEWGDENLFLVGYNREFYVESKLFNKEQVIELLQGKNDPNYDAQYAKEINKEYFIFPLEAYIHSGVRLYLSAGCGVDRAWDVSDVGAVFVHKGKEFGNPTKEGARKYALGLIEEWNDYLSGNVYGYQIEDKEGQCIESGWGYYGDYDTEGGALFEARSLVNHLTNKGITDQHGQYLFEFAQGGKSGA